MTSGSWRVPVIADPDFEPGRDLGPEAQVFLRILPFAGIAHPAFELRHRIGMKDQYAVRYLQRMGDIPQAAAWGW